MPRAFSATESNAIRERLLRAGREAIGTAGFRRTPVATLARAAGISPGGFYLFFPSKEAVLVSLLETAEAEVRARLRACARHGDLRQLLRILFVVVSEHPLLRCLADPEELAWLARVLGPDFMAKARTSDDAFFAELVRVLKRRGVLARSVDPNVFAALPPAALAITQQRALIGEDRFAALVTLFVDALAVQLAPAGARNGTKPAPTTRPTKARQ